MSRHFLSTFPALSRIRGWRTALLSGLLLLGGALAAQAQFVTDGTRESAYGAALALQTTPTGFGNAITGTPILANGSELDGAYAMVSGGVLHLFLAGNIQSNGNQLEIFCDTKPGGQNVLLGSNPDVDANGLNAMAGLTFDTGFGADYYLTVSISAAGAIEVHVASLNEAINFGGLLATGTTSPLTFTVPGSAASGVLGIDNTNIAGVDNMSVGIPAFVATGVELEIPLAALGAPANDLRLCAFVNGDTHSFVSNQVLGGLPLSTGNLGLPAGVNFATLAGNQFFTVSNGGAATGPVIGVTPNPFALGSTPVGQPLLAALSVANTGTTALTISNITSSNPVFTAGATTLTVAAGATGSVGVTFTPTAAGAQTATLTFTSNATNGPTTTVTLTATATGPATAAVDGQLTAADGYGAALALQTTPTGFGDATGGGQTSANGSELDAAYARVANGNLYLLLTGNLQSNGNRLNLFFDTNSGTGQRLLSANNPNVDNNGLNRHAGLFFDGGFTADYFLTLNVTIPSQGPTLDAGFAPVNGAGGNGVTLTNGAPGLSQTISFGAGTGQLALDNSNTAGVTTSAVGTPAAVTTGAELRIPLAALGNPTGPIRVSAFITSPNHSFMSNQVLAGLPLATANLGDPANVNFGAHAGNQFFSIANGTAAAVAVTSASVLSFGSTAVGTPITRRLVVRNAGNAPLSLTGVTSTNPVFSAAPVTGTVAPGDSLALTVTFVPTAAGTISGSLLLATNDLGQPSLSVGLLGTATAATAPMIEVAPTLLNLGAVPIGTPAHTAQFVIGNIGTAPLVVSGITTSNPAYTVAPGAGTIAPGDTLAVTVTFAPTTAGLQFATALIVSNDPVDDSVRVVLNGTGQAALAVTLDGVRDPLYGAPLAVQTTPTGFGDATQGQPTTANGSELDAAYATIADDNLYLLLTGNLQTNGNKLELFFDTQAGGQNVLLGTNPNVDGNGLNRMAGLTFDAGFAPDYYLTLNGTVSGGALTLAAHGATLTGAPLTGGQLGSGPGTSINLDFGNANLGVLTLNNSNVAGVSGTVLGTPAAVTTGVELAIPLAALGNPAGPIRVSAFINGAQHDVVSNQVLGGLPTGTANLGDPLAVNFAATANAGNQFFAVANGPVASLSDTSLMITASPGGQVSQSFTIYNTGNAPLSLTGLISSNAAFTATPATGTIASGDSLVVTVTFTGPPPPTAVILATLTVQTNDPTNPALVINLRGEIQEVGLPEALAAAVTLLPNPAAGRATLRVPAALLTEGATVTMLDALGRTVRTRAGLTATGIETFVSLDLKGLPAGTYAVRLLTPAGTLTRRLVLLTE